MKFIPTASQTVGPFFSLGLAPLFQDATQVPPSGMVDISGIVLDGEGKPIPDCILEFWTHGTFTRVATSSAGRYLAVLEAGTTNCEVLLFMRGLLKPVYTRLYFEMHHAIADHPILKLIPKDRLTTLIAKQGESAGQFAWNIVMQGENETVFFEF